MNPPGSVPIFLASTAGCSTEVRRTLALRIAVNVFAILVVSMFVGSHILDFFGISLPVVQVGGGLLITSIGWSLLNETEDRQTEVGATSWTADQVATRAFYPLTLPLTVGPGSISIAITLGANTAQAGISRVAQLPRPGHGGRSHRPVHLPLLPVRGGHQPPPRAHRQHRVSPALGVHRPVRGRADPLEWRERPGSPPGSQPALTRRRPPTGEGLRPGSAGAGRGKRTPTDRQAQQILR